MQLTIVDSSYFRFAQMTLVVILVVSVCASCLGQTKPTDTPSEPQVEAEAPVPAEEVKEFRKFPYPKGVEDVGWLEERKKAQLAAKPTYDTFCDFQFADLVESSGVTFEHVSVDDACRINIAGHYDHGNGVAIADVDNDGLLDVYWATQIGSNQLWRNLGGGKFENITPPVLAVSNRISVGVSFADTDNDGDQDLFVSTVRGGNSLFVNDGKGNFSDATKTSGLGYSGHPSAGVFF